ncbi:hypothetical protein, partial [Synechococcus sp. CS-1328]|uniref:hypothetical protein n=1 Tax=Synechococcus sp. CS-1328 TaxID=2847976 RepID=UPI00223BEF0A
MTLSPVAPAPAALRLEALTNLHSAGWLVLVCRGGAAVALDLARLGKPLLVVEADPEQVEELHRQVAENPASALTVCCELLGSETGETCWYRYNDARQNGTTGLDALQGRYPNLRLQSLELRPLRRLDALLAAWEERGRSSGDDLLKGPGALVAYGVEALPLLQGGSSWLERFSQLVVPPPRLEAEGDLEAWPVLLRHHCLQPSADNPQPQGGEAWILLEQDRERLLEEQLQQALDQISTVAAERNALKAERDGLNTKQQELTAQRDGLTKERDALEAERDGLNTKQQELTAQRDGLTKERDALKAERDGLSTKQQELTAQRDGLTKERDALKAERDGLSTKQQELTAQRDGLTKERDALKAERDGLNTKQQELTTQRDGLSKERDALKAERDGLNTKQQELTAQRDGLSKERDALKAERDGLITKQQELTAQRDGLSKERDALKAERDGLNT